MTRKTASKANRSAAAPTPSEVASMSIGQLAIAVMNMKNQIRREQAQAAAASATEAPTPEEQPALTTEKTQS